MYWQVILPQYPQSTPQAYKDAVHIILYSVFIVHVRNIFLPCLRIDFRGDLEGTKKRRQRTNLPLGLFPVSPDEFCRMQLQHFKRSVLEARSLLSVWSKKSVTPEACRSSPGGQSYERSFLKDIRMNKLNWEYSLFSKELGSALRLPLHRTELWKYLWYLLEQSQNTCNSESTYVAPWKDFRSFLNCARMCCLCVGMCPWGAEKCIGFPWMWRGRLL